MIIIHGDNHVASRQQLGEYSNTLKNNGLERINLRGDKLTFLELEEALLVENLFTREFIVIENLLFRQKSKTKDKLIKLINEYKGTKELILWEKKSISKTELKKLGSNKPKISEHKLPFEIFKFTTSLTPKNKAKSINLYHQALKTSSDVFIFSMLARQISNLIVAKTSPSSITGAPWQKVQLIKQSSDWELEELKSFHSQLLATDFNIKTGKTSIDLATQLDLMIIEL